MLTQYYFHRGKCHEEVLYLQPLIPLKRFDIFFTPDWGMLRRSRRVLFFLEYKAHARKIQKKGTRWREFCIPPAASHPIPPPRRNYLEFAPKGVASTTLRTFKSFRLLYRHSRRRLGSPWVSPINAAPKRLKLDTVTPGAT